MLREIRDSDVEDMYAIKSDPELTSKYGVNPHANPDQTAKWIDVIFDSYLKRNAILWVIAEKGRARAIGSFTLWNLDLESFRGELGYEINREFWGRGIASEVMPKILDYAFLEMELNRVEACPLSGNVPSKGLLEKFGFKMEGKLRERVFFEGRFIDQLYYGILKEEWLRP